MNSDKLRLFHNNGRKCDYTASKNMRKYSEKSEGNRNENIYVEVKFT